MNLTIKKLAASSNDAQVEKFLKRLRWPNRVNCWQCGGSRIRRYTSKGRGFFYCESCRLLFSVTSGTLLHGSNLPALKWARAIGLIWQERNITIKEFQRRVGTTYKTAWRIVHFLRNVLDKSGSDEETFLALLVRQSRRVDSASMPIVLGEFWPR